jgi:hypothetical protein
MAINIDTQDLINYPGTVKRVTLDQEAVVPTGYEGDEQYMLSFSTTAYSDNTARTRIQDYYITHFNAGWAKSSGFVGSTFALTASGNALEVKIDATTSGVSSSGYYRIELTHNSGLPITGEVVAADMETKIRALADTFGTADIGYKLAYMNSSVEFVGGRFWIVSGSVGQYYSGASRSSVKVRAATAGNDCSTILGFNITTDSESLDSIDIKEALVTSAITGGVSTTLTLNQAIGAATGDCIVITDGTNTDYTQLTNVTGGGITLTFSASTVSNSYTANSAKIQILREQDPDAGPALWFDNIDKISRHGIKTMVNQIDYSS